MSADAHLAVTATREGERVRFEVALENRGGTAFTRTLPTSKTVDVEARDAAERVVYAYGADLLFLQVLTDLTVPPRTRRVLLSDAFNAPVGALTLEARLPGPGPEVAARVSL